jgi:hypothetical protein
MDASGLLALGEYATRLANAAAPSNISVTLESASSKSFVLGSLFLILAHDNLAQRAAKSALMCSMPQPMRTLQPISLGFVMAKELICLPFKLFPSTSRMLAKVRNLK